MKKEHSVHIPLRRQL